MEVRQIRFKVLREVESKVICKRPGGRSGSFVRKVEQPQQRDWSLGLGPCGRVVAKLEMVISEGLLAISQTSFPMGVDVNNAVLARKEREIKVFYYKISEVVGRIEATQA